MKKEIAIQVWIIDIMQIYIWNFVNNINVKAHMCLHNLAKQS